MRHPWRYAIFMTAMMAALPASGQDEAVIQKQTKTKTVTKDGQIVKISTVMKSKVLIQDDAAGGQIVDFVLNDGGCIDYVVASYEDQYYLIPYSVVTLQGANNTVFVDISPTQFKQVQFFANNKWPNFAAAAYQQKVFTTFGVRSPRRDNNSTFKAPLNDRRGPGDRNRDRGDRPDRDADTPDGDDADAKPDPKDLPSAKPDPKDPPNAKSDLKNPPSVKTPPKPAPSDKTPAPADKTPKPDLDKKPLPKESAPKKP